MTPDVSSPFPAEALEANRSGVLTDVQRRSLTSPDRGRGHDLFVAAFCVLLALVVLWPGTSVRNPLVRPLVAGGALVGAALLVLRPKVGTPGRIAQDLRSGRVESIEGAIAKSRSWVPAGGRISIYYLEIAGRSLHVGRRGWEAAPDVGHVRAYYLPGSQWVVNLERLPDRPLPREVLQSPAELKRTLGAALGLRGGVEAAEARAELSALAARWMPERADTATPPPLLEHDPRPLAQAILGSWHSGAIQLSFASDGTVAVRGLMGPERRARWSVDTAGRLRSDAMGAEQAANAWVAGDTLTISADGGALTFHRT